MGPVSSNIPEPERAAKAFSTCCYSTLPFFSCAECASGKIENIETTNFIYHFFCLIHKHNVSQSQLQRLTEKKVPGMEILYDCMM